MAAGADAPHLPYPVSIDAYGNGGFRFADMSHRGSLLCLPDGIWAWPVKTVSEINEAALAPVFERADVLDLFLIGGGRDPFALPESLRARFRALSIIGRLPGHRAGGADLQYPARRKTPRRRRD